MDRSVHHQPPTPNHPPTTTTTDHRVLGHTRRLHIHIHTYIYMCGVLRHTRRSVHTYIYIHIHHHHHHATPCRAMPCRAGACPGHSGRGVGAHRWVGGVHGRCTYTYIYIYIYTYTYPDPEPDTLQTYEEFITFWIGILTYGHPGHPGHPICTYLDTL